MQTGRAHHQVDRAFAVSVERDSHGLDSLVDASDGVAKIVSTRSPSAA
jgi:hypothetical protein